MRWAAAIVTTAVLALALLAGCATPYQDSGFTGGVTATRLDRQTVMISSRGNSFTDPAIVFRHAMLKAAETTLAAGFGHFQVVQGADTSDVLYYPRYGPMPKPGFEITIRMYPGPKPFDAPDTVFDAAEVVRYIRSG